MHRAMTNRDPQPGPGRRNQAYAARRASATHPHNILTAVGIVISLLMVWTLIVAG
jgi:hypothetical protein